jgi:hypothetical protein
MKHFWRIANTSLVVLGLWGGYKTMAPCHWFGRLLDLRSLLLRRDRGIGRTIFGMPNFSGTLYDGLNASG